MNDPDVRWKQRLASYRKAFNPWTVDLALKQTIENSDLVAHIEQVGVPVCERG